MERRQRRRGDTIGRIVGVIGILLVLVSTVRVQLQGNTLDRQQRQLTNTERLLGNEYTFALDGCKRLQILRVEDNRSHFADWKVFSVVSIQSHSQAGQAQIPPGQEEAERRFLRQLDDAVLAKTWVPLTNCAQAVNREGSHYKPPRPVPFSVRLPPKSALTIPPGSFK